MKTFWWMNGPLLAAAGLMLVATAGASDFHWLISDWRSRRAGGPDVCRLTSQAAWGSCRAGAQSDYWLAIAKSENLSDPAARRKSRKQALAELRDALRTCKEQLAARQMVCDRLDGAPYDPVIVPENFVTNIDNPYFPLTPGTTRIYVAQTAHGVVSNVVATTHNTVVILGVICVEVRDVVYTDGEVTEDTLDWFAQDKDGNVWYFGENTLEIADGLVVSVEGSFKAGVDGARPGIIMKAHPTIGDAFRQEFVLEQGEDFEEVIALNKSVTVPYGSFNHCVKVRETTALEPDTIVHDFYAPGIGPVLSIEMPSNERLELMQIIRE
jgi:hypothetical protein